MSDPEKTDPVPEPVDPGAVDPENPVTVDHDDLVEREADVVDEFAAPLPVEANEADAVEQKLDVPVDDEDEYPA